MTIPLMLAAAPFRMANWKAIETVGGNIEAVSGPDAQDPAESPQADRTAVGSAEGPGLVRYN